MTLAGATLRIGAVAGETSGDLLAGSVLRGLAARGMGLDARGIGGPVMARDGFEAWWSIDALSVRGYAEVLREYPRLHRLRESLKQRMLEWRPEVFLGIDAPDFNLDVERWLRERGVPVVHFIGPSIWAWRRGRIDKIRRAVDRILLVFPFEKAIYDAAGIDATYVGHPLADLIPREPDRQRARSVLGLTEQAQVVALLPGSRPAEVRYMTRTFVETAAWLHRRRPGVTFVLPVASSGLHEPVAAAARAADPPRGLDLRIVSGMSHDVLAAADTALIASGTATLEAALYGLPMVIAYRMAWASYQIMRHMSYLPYVGLPNILCEDSVVPEFLQAEARAELMGPELLEHLESPQRRAVIRKRFAALHEQLRCGCAERAAEAILEVRARRSHG